MRPDIKCVGHLPKAKPIGHCLLCFSISSVSAPASVFYGFYQSIVLYIYLTSVRADQSFEHDPV